MTLDMQPLRLAMHFAVAFAACAVQAHSPECGQSVAVVRAVGACSAMAYDLERRITSQYQRLQTKFAGDHEAVRALIASQTGWQQYVYGQCLAEHAIPVAELRLGIEAPPASRRRGIECAIHLMRARLAELERL